MLAGITLLIGGKLAVMAAVGPWFGLTQLAAVRAGLLLAPGEAGRAAGTGAGGGCAARRGR